MQTVCSTCSKSISRPPSQISTSGHSFCSKSCAATFNNKVVHKRSVEGKCKVCNLPISTRDRYCSNECKTIARQARIKPKIFKPEETQKTLLPRIFDQKIVYLKNKESNKADVVSWRQRQKRRAIEYKGGCCQLCGYDRSVRALSFHHLDPKQKDFGMGTGSCHSWEKVKKELDKCVLVCMNCHAEIHAGLVSAPSPIARLLYINSCVTSLRY